MLGAVRLVRVPTAALLDRVHAAFLEQRGARFDQMGVDNIFAEPPFPQFFPRPGGEGFWQRTTCLCLHALYAGDEIVATAGALMAGNHYSQYINSTTIGAAARYA